jgi:putative ABC transport system permease protein
MLLIGAALLLQSVVHLRNVNLGFNPANLLTLRVSLPLTRYDTIQKKSSFFEDLRRRVQTVPGVQAATVAWFLPMTGFAGSPVQDANKPPLKLNERPIAKLIIVSPDYFRTLGVPIRHGRDFNQHDLADSQRVAIVDESFARRFWPSDPNPVGQRILIGFSDPRPTEIVGIVANVHQELEDNSWPQSVYVAFAQHAQPSAMLAVRTNGDPARLTGVIRQQVRSIDRDQPISTVRTMEALVDDQIGQRRLTVTLLGAFAGVALLLALIGIYGVITYSVVQRTQEIGIRRALGAQHGNILGLVVGQGLGLTLAGVAVGVFGALGLTSVLTHLLFQVSATDPATFVAIAVLFIVVALAASYIPAHRATRIDPLKALQAD